MKLKINPKFRDLISPLTSEESLALEKAILEDGCQTPIVTWKGTIVDGHNRYRICNQHDIPFKTVEKEFDSELDAMDWIVENQFARRNLTPGELKYLRGKMYQLRKTIQGGSQSSNGNNFRLNVAKELSKKLDVDERTIRLDEKFVEAVDKIQEVIGGTIKHDILHGEKKMTQKEVIFTAKQDDEQIKKILDDDLDDDDFESIKSTDEATSEDLAAYREASDKRYVKSSMKVWMDVTSNFEAKRIEATKEPMQTEVVGYLLMCKKHIDTIVKNLGLQQVKEF